MMYYSPSKIKNIGGEFLFISLWSYNGRVGKENKGFCVYRLNNLFFFFKLLNYDIVTYTKGDGAKNVTGTIIM